MASRFQRRSQRLASAARLALLRTALRPIARWQPLHTPDDGYTLILGCVSDLADVLVTNLRMVDRLDRSNLRQVICVFDRPANDATRLVEATCRQRFPSLPLTFHHYSRLQRAVAERTGWGWVYSWLSWSIGIGATRTRHAFLHDFDAMPLRADFFEQRYRMMLGSGCTYLGVEPYVYGEFTEADQLVVTPEMGFDVPFVRAAFKPLDLFNRIAWHNGRHVHFDTFLYAQARAGEPTVMRMRPDDLVHPAQMLCQYTALCSRPTYVPPARNTLLMVPYFLHLAGREEPIRDATDHLGRTLATTIPFLHRRMDLSQLSAAHVADLARQIGLMETTLFGHMTLPARRYVEAMRQYVHRFQSPAAPQPLRLAA